MTTKPLPPILRTLNSVGEHIEEEDPLPQSIMISADNVTMSMMSIDELLEWADIITDNDTAVTFLAQRLWKQAEDQPFPTVITIEYLWEDDNVAYRVVASSPHTMDQLSEIDVDERIEVTRSQVETLMIQGHAHKAGLPKFEPL